MRSTVLRYVYRHSFKGQSGAIIFSHRVNKMVHAYPYRHKSEAVEILDEYLDRQLPRLQPQATCIQTDRQGPNSCRSGEKDAEGQE